MTAPEAVRGLIEARGVGLLRAEALDEAPLALAVDLGQVETERLPPERTVLLRQVAIPLLHKVESRCFPAAIRQYLVCGRSA
jgi:HPr kinase/phosphorylase